MIGFTFEMDVVIKEAPYLTARHDNNMEMNLNVSVVQHKEDRWC